MANKKKLVSSAELKWQIKKSLCRLNPPKKRKKVNRADPEGTDALENIPLPTANNHRMPLQNQDYPARYPTDCHGARFHPLPPVGPVSGYCPSSQYLEVNSSGACPPRFMRPGPSSSAYHFAPSAAVCLPRVHRYPTSAGEARPKCCRNRTDLTDNLLTFAKKQIASLRSELECPVCLLPSQAPIYTCKLQHIICGKCWKDMKSKSRDCPVCREDLSDDPARHRLMERLAEQLKEFNDELQRLLSLSHS